MEKRRKAFHLAFGVFAILISFLIGRDDAVLVMLVAFLGGLVVLNRKLKGHNVPVADELLASFGRPNEPPGYGAFWFVLGILAIMSYVQSTNGMLASLLMLGVSDAASGFFGLKGKTRIPYNRNKSLEGSAAFFLVSLLSYFWIGWLAIPFALLGALVESVDIGLDDNLLIALFCILFFGVFR